MFLGVVQVAAGVFGPFCRFASAVRRPYVPSMPLAWPERVGITKFELVEVINLSSRNSNLVVRIPNMPEEAL